MRKKLTLLAFSLLLAVGWTNDASAQRQNNSSPAAEWVSAPVQERAMRIPQSLMKGDGVRKAPNRANNDVYANTVYTKAQYGAISYTWYEGPTTNYPSHTASLTDTVTDPNQMYWLFRSTYMNQNIPGIRYNDVIQGATVYYGEGRGWEIGTRTKVDLIVYIDNTYGRLFSINIDYLDGTELMHWSASSNYIYSGWSYTGTRTRTTYDGSSCWYFPNGGVITVPASLLPAEGYKVTISAMSTSNTNTCDYQVYNETADGNNINLLNGFTAKNTRVTETYYMAHDYGTISAPNLNGYTIFLLKLKDFPEYDAQTDYAAYRAEYEKRAYPSTAQELIDVFDEYYASAELLTDGLRVGEGSETSGTVFAYQGALNRFYLIGKGKTATVCSKYIFGCDGPFYRLYEEFSPTATTASEATTDLYQNMWTNGDYYPVKHDCQSVLSLSHYYAMYGKDTTVYKSVSPMVFYIPDLRSIQDDRNYEEGHQPQVGLYRIFLTAETEPSDTYAQDSTYTVTLAWTSTLNDMVNNTVPQTYVIYTVTTDSLGNETYTPLDTLYNPNELVYTYDVQQTQASQQIRYVVLGFPIYDPEHPDVIGNDYFFTYSNPDDVQIPGLFDFMILYRERYESDFIIQQERNYYRNYLYPTNLSPGTGMTLGQLKQEWPNQTASYTLWRDNTGIAKLEVRGIGNKVYYRIRYYDATQDTTNVNDIAIPNGYQKMPNE